MCSHWSLSVNKSHDSRTLLSILADLKSAVIWTVSTRPVIFKPRTSYLVNVTRAPITIGMIVTFRRDSKDYKSACFLYWLNIITHEHLLGIW